MKLLHEYLLKYFMKLPVMQDLLNRYMSMQQEKEMALDAKEVALSERATALAARDRAIADFNIAIAARDAALNERQSGDSILDDKIATADDIRYCFRLILGRPPNKAEWPGHSAMAGQDLYNVVRHYVTSREFAERGMLNKSYLEKVDLLHLSHFDIFVSLDDIGISRGLRELRAYEPHVTAVFDRNVKPGMAVLDIGANIGYMTMYLALLVGTGGRVIAVEPNPENVALIEASRRVNGFEHVDILQCAAGAAAGILALNLAHCNGMTGELPQEVGAIIGSRTVACLPLDAVLPKDRPIALMKIDVEGAELHALSGMQTTIDRDRPIIVSEFSPEMMQGTSVSPGIDYLRFLIAKGYELRAIELDGSERSCGVDPGAVMTAYERSGFDHIDILAVHQSARN